MSKKIKFILYFLEIIAIIVAIILLAVFKYWPEYEETLGSSEKLFLAKKYKTGIEVKILNGPQFIIIIDNNQKISYLFFENEESSTLANKNIEGTNLELGIKTIIEELIKNNQLKTESIYLINYGDKKIYNKTVLLLDDTLQNKNVICKIIQSTSTWQKKSQEINLNEEKDTSILWNLYIKSLEIIENTSNNKNKHEIINENLVSDYADTVYQKLETYKLNSNITNQDKNDMILPIQYIPANEENSIYPNSNSWYYIKENKVYAEISFSIENSVYTFCYDGSKESRKKGGCR